MLYHIDHLPHQWQSIILIENYAEESTKWKPIHTKGHQLTSKVVVSQTNVDQKEGRNIAGIKHEHQNPRVNFIVDIYHGHDYVNYAKDFLGLRGLDIISLEQVLSPLIETTDQLTHPQLQDIHLVWQLKQITNIKKTYEAQIDHEFE